MFLSFSIDVGTLREKRNVQVPSTMASFLECNKERYCHYKYVFFVCMYLYVFIFGNAPYSEEYLLCIYNYGTVLPLMEKGCMGFI